MAGPFLLSACLCFLLCSQSVALQWPVIQQSAQEAFPNIELSLAPPAHPWPQVAAELGNLEESRERMENANMDKLQREFNNAESHARKQIGDVIGRTMRAFDDPKLANAILAEGQIRRPAAMFRQLPQDTVGSAVMSVKVNVLPGSPPDPILREDIEDVEFLRSDREKDMFDAALTGPKMLINFILNEMEVQVRENMNNVMGVTAFASVPRALAFMEGRSVQLPAQTNIRMVPTDVNYPTVASMVQAMETRRDIAENLERRHILEKELDLILLCNKAIEEGLKAAVSRVLARYSTLTKSLRNAA